MRFRFALSHAFLGMAACCVALAIGRYLYLSFQSRLIEEERLTYDLSASVDSIYFVANGKLSPLERVSRLFAKDHPFAPIGSCTLSWLGTKNEFDLKELEHFPVLTRLELYQCEVTDKQWRVISTNPSIRVVELSAGTTISQEGRVILRNANIRLVE